MDYDDMTLTPSNNTAMLAAPLPWDDISASVLETQMERNVTDVVLSFLTLADYARLCRTSKFLRAAVYESSHLFAENCGGPWIRFGRTGNHATSKNNVVAATEIKSNQMDTPTLPDEMKEMLDRFPYLKTINLHELAPMGDDLIRVLNESRSANQCTSVSLHGLSLSYWCPHTLQLENVKHLTLSGHSIRVRVSSLIQPLKLLQSLTLQQCPGIRDEDVLDIGRMAHLTLQEITLNHVKLVKPVASFPVLKRASFVGCFGLKDLSGLWMPQLTELNLSFCVRLTGEQVKNLVEQLPVLETLIIMKCNGIRTLEIVSNNLRRLDATFTHNLEVLRLACPNLYLLETHFCYCLEEVVLENAASLPALNLDGSFRLREVQVFGAHQLICLSLRGCRNLQSCHFDTPNLQCVNVTGARTVALRFCKYIRKAVLRSWSSP